MNQIEKVYNGNEIIATSGFTMQSNYILPLLNRMVNEKIIVQAAATLVQAILTYKHTEENPYPSREELARFLGVSVSYVKKGLASIKEAGILSIVKSGRKNTYSFKSFFTLLEKFIIEYKKKKNYGVKIAELLKIKVVKKETEEDQFQWAEEYAGEKEIVPAAVPAEETEESETTLPEEINRVVEAYGISSEGVKAIQQSYAAYGDKLDKKVFIEKIVASLEKKDFVKYYNTCITSAFVAGEKPTIQRKPAVTGGKKFVREEAIPEWMQTKEDKPVQRTTAERISELTTLEQIEEERKQVQIVLNLSPDNKQALETKGLLDTREAEIKQEIEKASLISQSMNTEEEGAV